jgi:hypothetical protein
LFKKTAALSREDRIISNEVVKMSKKSDLKITIPAGKIKYFVGYASHLLNFSDKITLKLDRQT